MEKQGYNTKSRKLISSFLQSKKDGTVTVADIISFVRSNGININSTTVYRYLNRLEFEKKVIKFSAENGQGAVYQFVNNENSCDEHIHIQCISCGKLIHLDCDFMDEFKGHIKDKHGFMLKCSGSILYGLCGECNQKQKK